MMIETYISERDKHEFVDGYIEALLWSTSITNEEGEYLGTVYDKCYEVDPESLAAIERCALAFLMDNARALDLAAQNGRPWECLGHDAHLTREGHGTGFWDRYEIRKTIRDHLTNRARADRTEAYVWTEEIDGETIVFVEGIE